MDVVMTLSLLACGVPILLIVYGVMRYYSRAQGGLLFGARVEPGWTEEPEVRAIRKTFVRQMNRYALLLLVLQLGLLLIPYVSIAMTVWVIWMIAAIVVLEIPYVRANHALRRWKAERGYVRSGEQRRLVELKGLGQLRCVRWLDFLWPGIVCAAACAAPVWLVKETPEKWLLVGTLATFLLVEVIFGAAAVWMDKTRNAVISTDSRVNLNYNRARRMLWRKMWLWCAWLTAALAAVCAAGSAGSFNMAMTAVGVGSAVYGAAILALCVWLIRAQRALHKSYQSRMDLPIVSMEDDDCWLGGLLYYNPDDRRVNVEKRVGVGFTINMATPVGKVFSVVIALLIVGTVVFCGAFTIPMEFCPLKLSVEGDMLTAAQVRENYSIPLDAIEDLELVQSLPSLARVNGTGMPKLSKGTYRDRDTGERCELFLNPENGEFLKFTAGDTIYYMSAADDEQTVEIYNELN